MPEPKRIVFDLGGKVRVSPPMWTDNHLDVEPGDLSKFAPTGCGLYGYQLRDGATNPFTGAPSQESSGGVVYFDNDISQPDFNALLRVLEVHKDSRRPRKDFAAFIQTSEQPGKDGYLMQMRIVTNSALYLMYRAIDDAGSRAFPEQELTLREALWAFIEHEKERWGTSFTQDEEKGLMGLFGGDGDFAREQLAFGFMIENGDTGVYRIWSRAWLVTK